MGLLPVLSGGLQTYELSFLPNARMVTINKSYYLGQVPLNFDAKTTNLS